MAVNHYNKKKYVDRTAGDECIPGRIYHAMELSDGGHNTDYAAAPCHVYIYAEVFCGRNCHHWNERIGDSCAKYFFTPRFCAFAAKSKAAIGFADRHKFRRKE